MDNKIEIFKNEQFGEVRTILEGEKVLFCAADVKGSVSLTDFSPVGTHRICLLISQNRIPRRFLRKMSLHFTTDIF